VYSLETKAMTKKETNIELWVMYAIVRAVFREEWAGLHKQKL
jgi:hypothetical protein